jgi:hypothetical protein
MGPVMADAVPDDGDLYVRMLVDEPLRDLFEQFNALLGWV